MQGLETFDDNLKRQILESFANTEPPTTEILVEHSCSECRAIRRVFRDENWQTIMPRKIKWAYDKLPLFTPEAHCYFLPAFLL